MKKLILLLLFFPTVALSAEDKVLPLNLQTGSQTETVEEQNSKPLMDEEDLNFDQPLDAFGEPVNFDADTKVPIFNQPSQNKNELKVNTRQSLTDNIRKNAPEEIQEEQSQSGTTSWVGQLISSAKENFQNSESKTNPLADMLEQSQVQNRRSNASVFDISGVMLRMSYKQAEEALTKRG